MSELVRPKPAAAVLAWFEDVPDASLYLSVLTLGEIRKGVERLPTGKRREQVRVWLEHDLREWFGARILDIDAAVAERWGRLLAQVDRPIPAIDSLIAATALHHDLRLVTRNESDFADTGVEVVNIWAT